MKYKQSQPSRNKGILQKTSQEKT